MAGEIKLFVHLEGEALNVALLMPEGEHTTLEGLLQGLLSYYNSPERLAVFRRRFDIVTRREGGGPLCVCYGIIDFSGSRFGDIGPQARTRMVRDRFISEQ